MTGLIVPRPHIAPYVHPTPRLTGKPPSMTLLRRLILVTVILFCGKLSAAAQPLDRTPLSCRSVPDSEVILREDIRNAGLARLSELFRLADRWHTATIDGYTWNAQASGLSPLSNPRWALLIDNVPVEMALFGAQSLDALPINVNDVACIELVARPHVAAGELRQDGAIYIHTRRPDQGMTLGASVAAGNEVNDPGPFAYTPRASRNVDRIGPIGTGTIEIRSHGRFARLSGKLDEFHVTDQQIELRARQLYNADSKPRIHTNAVAFSAGMETRWGTQSIVAGRSETKDLLFFETFGVEIPSIRRVDMLAAAGSLRMAGGEVRYRGSYVSHELLERQNASDINLDFQKRAVSGGLESHLGLGPVRATVGASVQAVEALTNQILSDSRALNTRLFSLVEATFAGRFSGSLFGSWIQSEERAAFAVMPSVHIALPYEQWIGLSASFARRTMKMDASLSRWTHVGYTLPSRPLFRDELPEQEPFAGEVEHLSYSPEPQSYTADAEIGGRMPQGVNYLVGAYYRRSLADYFADHDISYSEASSGFLTRTTVIGAVAGEIVGIHADLGLNLLPGFSPRITYVAERVRSADPLFYRMRARVPSHRLAFTATYAPNDRFSLYARARYQPSTEWNEYKAASIASGGFYPWFLPERVLVDVAATKRLWYDHLLATLSVRNLLNEPYSAHPVGAVFNMSFHFSLRASFNSEAWQ